MLPKLSKLRVKKVYKTQIINDRGIHICKSMLAWQNLVMVKRLNQQGKREASRNYYVKFDKAYKEEITHLMSTGKTEEEAKKQAPIIIEARKCSKMEAGDEAVKSHAKNESMGL
jgi:arginyl-tRNA synthetase